MTNDTDHLNDVCDTDNQIAVIGISGRYPESPNLNAFWKNLQAGNDCLVGVNDDELDNLGIPARLYNQANFVRRGTRLPYADCFDARFFGYTPREAEAMDPQCRVFLETSYAAIEDAGYDPYGLKIPVGIFAGSNPNDYASLVGVADPTDPLTGFDQLIGSDKDFLATRVSHRLNLKGPAMTVQTACSTSLVAVHMAVQSLLSYECSMCLAGGVTVNLRQGVGYFYQDGMILSPEGKCRAFDENASGTTLGQGCGVVLLKRLNDAVEDSDHIYAVIRGSAINNDGSDKLSYTAPSENGQAEVIALAHELANVDSDTISYVEAHGTGTKLGDPIEIAALTRAFSAGTERKQYCAIGSAKTNFGHTDAAAGITGFLKTVLSLHNQEIVPSLHFDNPNPVINFAETPFFVNTEKRLWSADDGPRRAGVSAFGIGGTNAHVVLEEAPATKPSTSSREFQLLPLSAKTPDALERRISELAGFVASNRDVNLGDIAHTLRFGRSHFEHRATVAVADGNAVVVAANNESDSFVERLITGFAKKAESKMVWLYSGQGSQYVGMGQDLYHENECFKRAIDHCADLFQAKINVDIRELIFAEPDDVATEKLQKTAYTQPALFAIEYAMGALLKEHGVKPNIVIGHSIGEFAAAVEAGIITLKDATMLVAERGRLMQSMETGSMLAVPMPADELVSMLPDGLALAAENATGMSVVSGPNELISVFKSSFDSVDLESQIIKTSHAFHSSMMEQAALQFEKIASSVSFKAPSIPMMSNVTGTLLSNEEAVSPAFWAKQIISAVKFRECVATCEKDGPAFYLELGPGRTLSTLVKRNDAVNLSQSATTHTLRHPKTSRHDMLVALDAIGSCWCNGFDIDWSVHEANQQYQRISLPTYPFARDRHWGPNLKHVLALPQFGEVSNNISKPVERLPVTQWLYAPSWQRAGRPARRERSVEAVRVALLPDTEAGRALQAKLQEDGPLVSVFPNGESYRYDKATREYFIDVSTDEDLESVFEHLQDSGTQVDHILHAWLSDPTAHVSSIPELETALALGVHTAQACGRASTKMSNDSGLRIDFLTAGAHMVLGDEEIRPDASMLAGPAKVIPLEYPGVSCRTIDLSTPLDKHSKLDFIVDELNAEGSDEIVALRSGYRWAYTVSLRASGSIDEEHNIRSGGCYLIVGGLGGVGLSISNYLVDKYKARLVLTSRSGRPQRTEADSETNRRLDILTSIEKKAETVLVVAADASDEESMEEAVSYAEASMGHIDGVIVAAGVADQFGAIHRRSREATSEAISAKVHGSLILGNIFKNRSLDFMMLSSSIATMLYHNRFAQVGYVTGNSFVEAFSLRANQLGIPSTTVAWDDWTDLGMSVRAASSFSDEYGSAISLVDEIHSFSPADGVKVFEYALSTSEPLLYVSTTNLAKRMEFDVYETSPFLQQALGDDSNKILLEDVGSTAELVRRVWSELLGFEEISTTDDFFELGGDSLQAARMADKLSRSLAIEVPLNTIFDNSALATLVDVLDNLLLTGTTQIENPPMEGKVRLGPAQTRYLARENPNPSLFNISVLLRSEKDVDIDKLTNALNLLVAQHEALRLRLRTINGEVQQSVVPIDEFSFRLERVRVSESRDSRLEELRLAADGIQLGLDLWQGPVFRAVLFESGESWRRLLLVVHHMVSDRVSLFLFLDGLNEAYAQLTNSSTATLSSRTASYQAWVDAQAEFISINPEYASNWVNRDWSAVKPVPRNVKISTPINTNRSAHAIKYSIPAALSSQILKHSAGKPDELLLLGLGDAVAEWSDSNLALIETIGHGRRILPTLDVSRTIGFFLTYNPLLITFEPEKSLENRLQSLRSTIDIGWTFEACKQYHPDRKVRKQIKALPRSEVLFNFVGREIESEQSALFLPTDEDRGNETDVEGKRDHLISVMAEVTRDNTISLTFVYSAEFHTKLAIDTLAESVSRSLVKLIPQS